MGEIGGVSYQPNQRHFDASLVPHRVAILLTKLAFAQSTHNPHHPQELQGSSKLLETMKITKLFSRMVNLEICHHQVRKGWECNFYQFHQVENVLQTISSN